MYYNYEQERAYGTKRMRGLVNGIIFSVVGFWAPLVVVLFAINH